MPRNVGRLPGLIDCHVHFREPGAPHKADMFTEAAAARSGGIFVVCEMPNTNPATNTILALADKVQRAKRVGALCDIRFFFGATAHEHVAQLKDLWTKDEHKSLKARCSGLKLYLDNSTGDMKADTSVVEASFKLCAELNIPLVCHCEHSGINNYAAELSPYVDVASHSLRRPVESEVASVGWAISLAEKYGTHLHVAHMSTVGAVTLVKESRAKGHKITCEVTPHHLFITTHDCCEYGARIKVNPPIREKERDGLWKALLDGDIDCIGTDHAPHARSEKYPVNPAPGAQPPSGMPAVEVSLPLMISIASGHWPHPTSYVPPVLKAKWDANQPTLTVEDLRRLMFTTPNKLFNLQSSSDDRLEVTLDPTIRSTIDELKLHSKCGWSPYHGWEVAGKFTELKTPSQSKL